MKPRIVEIPKIADPRGNLSFIENQAVALPFAIARCYWIYDVPGGEKRHGHAFRRAEELIVALSGSFDVVTKTTDGEQTFRLNRSYFGLYVPAGTWRELNNFSTNSVALVLSSTLYDPEDYVYEQE